MPEGKNRIVCAHKHLIYIKNMKISFTIYIKIIAGFSFSPYLCIVKS